MPSTASAHLPAAGHLAPLHRPDTFNRSSLPEGVESTPCRSRGAGADRMQFELLCCAALGLARAISQTVRCHGRFDTRYSARSMDVLRCKSPAMVKKGIAGYLLTHNLVRRTMARPAQLASVPARDLNFTSAQRLIWVFLAACANT